MRMGLDFVKLFPAEVVGGVKMLKALGGPYGNMKFMPTGGTARRTRRSTLRCRTCCAAAAAGWCRGGCWTPEILTPLRRWHAKRRRL